MSSHIAESFDITCDEVLYLENGSLTRYELTKGESIRYLIDSWNDE